MRLTINGMHLPTLSLSSALLLALTSLATVPTALAQDRKVFAHWMVRHTPTLLNTRSISISCTS